jgi:hypothetical protein
MDRSGYLFQIYWCLQYHFPAEHFEVIYQSESLWQFQTATWKGFIIGSYPEFTNQKLLNVSRMYLTAAPLFAYFQLWKLIEQLNKFTPTHGDF